MTARSAAEVDVPARRPVGRPALAEDPVARERRRAEHLRDLTALLQERPELTGVHPPADLSVEALRWSA